MRFPVPRSTAPARVPAAAVLALVLLCARVPGAVADPAQQAGRTDEPGHRNIVFPVVGEAGYSNDWHNPRSGGRVHLGNDLFAGKHTPVVAVADGVVSFIRVENAGLSGRMLTIKDEDGWSYRYIHLNNDTPGTDDGVAAAGYTVFPGVEAGARVQRGREIAFVGDSGNAEGTAPHLHFEMVSPEGEHLNPYASLRLSQGRRVANLCSFDANPRSRPSPASGDGYLALDTAGGVFAFGDVPFQGSIPALRNAGVPVGPSVPVAIESTPQAKGYRVLDDRGGVFSFGDAAFFGSIPALRASGVPVGPMRPVAIESTPSGGGYWVLDDRGGVFSFGDAAFFGSIPALRASGVPVGPMRPVAIESTPSGNGYLMLDDQGGVFAFGDAVFSGSLGTLREAGLLSGRVGVAGMAATPDGKGYWIADRRGGVYTFGTAGYFGSVPGVGVCEWADIVGMAPSATGKGYWMIGSDGRVWSFGDARYLGGLDVGGIVHAPAVGITLSS